MRITGLIAGCLMMSFTAAARQKPKLPQEKDMAAYLMVYFKDTSHGLYFALSNDGYSFTDINNGMPIIAGDSIAEQKGVRDPYLCRGGDGMFYMAMTDLHIFAKKTGLRNTEWERDGKLYGWGNNRGLVLMKSADLVHWTHSLLRVDKAFAGLDSIGCAWAPELIWDQQRNRIMMYYTMRYGSGKEKVYYTWMNKDFSGMETFPKPLFEYPTDKPYIDADITKVNGRYHLLYCSHDGTAGIKQATSDSLTTGYVYDPAWIDPEKGGCEAPTVFKRIGQDKWVLIYDIYSIRPHNFGFSETADFVHFTNLGHFNEGVMKATNFSAPKHCAVVQLTRKEAKQLAASWKLNMKFN